MLFTENETNAERLWGVANRTPYVKDGINDAVVNGRADAVNPLHAGTKAAAQYVLQLQPGETRSVVLRLSAELPAEPFADAQQVLALRLAEADAFYESQFGAQHMTEDERRVQRQAFAGMLWSKQFYYYEIEEWLAGDPAGPPPPDGSASTVATATGSTSTTPTSSPCPTSGNTPGTPPGTWRSIASRWQWWIRTSPSASWC